MSNIVGITYTGSTPGADSSTYSLFSTVTAFSGGSYAAMSGLTKLTLSLTYTATCTLKWYKSNDRGTTWDQVGTEILPTAVSGLPTVREYRVDTAADFKLDLVNGGSSQAAAFRPSLSLSSENRE